MRQIRPRDIKQLAQGPRARVADVGFEPRTLHPKSCEHGHHMPVGDQLHGVGWVGGDPFQAHAPSAGSLEAGWLTRKD